MAVLTIRSLPAALHRALKARAARHGRSMEAEVRAIIAQAIDAPKRVRIGSTLMQLRQDVGLTNKDVDALEGAVEERRNQGTHEPIAFE